MHLFPATLPLYLLFVFSPVGLDGLEEKKESKIVGKDLKKKMNKGDGKKMTVAIFK